MERNNREKILWKQQTLVRRAKITERTNIDWLCPAHFQFLMSEAVRLQKLIWNQAGRGFKATNLFFAFHYHSVFVFFRHDNTCTEGWLEHVDHQVVGKDVQLLYLISRHVGRPSNAIAGAMAKRSILWEWGTMSSNAPQFWQLYASKTNSTFGWYLSSLSLVFICNGFLLIPANTSCDSKSRRHWT